ncbi:MULTISPECIES: hypothetical protein [Achromobacter]|uniref:hypothetical protein n=1 Tax=Achromobacter TaxID=222 RepID=UPI000B306D99|nr:MULTISPECIES: hypothetical protein [Achromobacter]MCM2569730.1 hypothetical protein [Achromobacter xylosoxidans]
MTDTEKLLQKARQIATRAFSDPSESAVLDVFHELCAERDRSPSASEVYESATIH